MLSELWRTTWSLIGIIIGIALVASAVRLGTDPLLADHHRTMAVATLAPAGVLVLFLSHRATRAKR